MKSQLEFGEPAVVRRCRPLVLVGSLRIFWQLMIIRTNRHPAPPLQGAVLGVNIAASRQSCAFIFARQGYATKNSRGMIAACVCFAPGAHTDKTLLRPYNRFLAWSECARCERTCRGRLNESFFVRTWDDAATRRLAGVRAFALGLSDKIYVKFDCI